MNDPVLPSLGTFIANRDIDPALRDLIDAIASACWSISRAVRTAALSGNLGKAGTVNVQGEEQKPLDILAHETFSESLRTSRSVSAFLSEEQEHITWFKAPAEGDFIVSCDPLDGSSNLDVNLSVGTIFTVARVIQDDDRNVLRKGREMICAGYAIYGPSTILVLALGGRVDGFSLDEAEDNFVLTHPELRIPVDTSEFAINASRRQHWDDRTRNYIDECVAGKDGPRGKSFNMRWTASMVAEVHRILNRGGVFLYPADAENAEQGGKLRLMYEAIPMAIIVETAGGCATDGRTAILDLVPEHPHQRVPVVLGSSSEVMRLAAAYDHEREFCQCL